MCKFRYLIVFCAGILCSACEEYDPLQHFTIQKGKHYATHRIIESLQSDVLTFEAMFDASAIYDFKDDALQSNKNKLLGFSDCNATHHENSARFAWQWYNQQLEIYAYCYNDGRREEQFVGVVALHEMNLYKIEMQADSYVFYLNDLPPVKMKRTSTCRKGLHYMLWPYFGGSEPAPHNIHIGVKRHWGS